jgi:hypothetical protein
MKIKKLINNKKTNKNLDNIPIKNFISTIKNLYINVCLYKQYYHIF